MVAADLAVLQLAAPPGAAKSMMAWNCLIYVVMPDSQTFPQAKEDAALADREAARGEGSDLSSGVGRTTLSTYVCLLYYSLRPAATFDALDSYWPGAGGMLVKFGTEGGDHRVQVACSVLQACSGSAEKWRENRLHEPTPIDIEELARVDALDTVSAAEGARGRRGVPRVPAGVGLGRG